MRRGTTPTVTLTVTNADGSACDLRGQELHVTFKSDSGGMRRVEFTKREDEVDVSFDGTASTIEITLTQAETLRFATGRKVRVQLRCKGAGIAQATDIAEFMAEEILLEGQI